MTDDIIKRLREAIAAGPTPGPWFHAYDFGQIGSVENAAGHVILQAQQTAPGREDVDRRNKTAAYIAAASPDNIAALLDRLDKAERERERLREFERSAALTLPGVYYMDPPDGGDVSLVEQVRRMSQDAARYRWVRGDAPSYSERWSRWNID